MRGAEAVRGLERAPDYIEPVVGWRAWLVSEVEGRPLLGGVVFHRQWWPREPHVAECLHWRPQPLRPWRRAEPDHVAPGLRCRCGLYAADSLAEASRYARPGRLPEPVRWPTLHRVVGRVSLWGRVVECEHGWRASHAYPERLVVPTQRANGRPVPNAEAIAAALEVYGVPVEVVQGSL
jgi:hypothetical protein